MDNPGRVGSLLLAEKDIISDEVSRILLLLFCNIETDFDHSRIRLMHQERGGSGGCSRIYQLSSREWVELNFMNLYTSKRIE